MTKAIMYLKLFGVFLLVLLVGILYIVMRRSPTELVDVSTPDKPNHEPTPDLLGKLIKRKDEINEEIHNMSRSDLVDDINDSYPGEGS